MITYTLEAVIGVDPQGNPVSQTFDIQASNWNEARHKLEQLVQDAQLNRE
jgi:hypothetical protein